MTLHNAKGLEYPGRVHHRTRGRALSAGASVRRSADARGGAASCSTSASRAPSEKLYLTHAEERRRNGEMMPSIQSSFSARDRWRQRSTMREARSFASSAMAHADRRRRDIGFAGAVPVAIVTPRTFRRGERRSPVRTRPEDVAGRAALRERRAGEAQAVRQWHDRRAVGRRTRREGHDRLRRRDDRTKDARHRAGDPRARRRLVAVHATTCGTSPRSRASASPTSAPTDARRRAEHDPRAHGRAVAGRHVGVSSDDGGRRRGHAAARRRRAADRRSMRSTLESFAPQMRDGFFLVPRLATHEDPPSGA